MPQPLAPGSSSVLWVFLELTRMKGHRLERQARPTDISVEVETEHGIAHTLTHTYVIPHSLQGGQKWPWQGPGPRISHLGPCFRFLICRALSPCPVLSLPPSPECPMPPVFPPCCLFLSDLSLCPFSTQIHDQNQDLGRGWGLGTWV